MRIDHIEILNFKNIAHAEMTFCPKINCIVGRNGMGKSNLLEAIHYLSFVRGFRSLPERGYMRHGRTQMLLKASYGGDAVHELSLGMVEGKRKTLKADGKEYRRLSEHIGRFPLVVITPQDNALVAGAADERRRFMDMVISQCDEVYLSHLMKYTRALESRNRMLRSGIRDHLLYESVETPLCASASAIHQIRSGWVADLSPLFAGYYRALGSSDEVSGIEYRSSLNEQTMPDLLTRNRQRDALLGFTSAGPHRDDLTLTLNGYSMRSMGSQGQIKSVTIALKLSVHDLLRRCRTVNPILLLDDVFDKLDSTRVERLMNLVGPDSEFGQIFVTDTNREHLDRILSGVSDSLLLQADNGSFAPVAL